MSERAVALLMAGATVVVIAFAGFVLVHAPAPPPYSPAPDAGLGTALSAAPTGVAQPAPSATPGPSPSARPATPPLLSDSFDRPDSVDLGAAPTGQVWTVSGPAGMRILGGRAVTSSEGRGYLSTALGAGPAPRLLATGSFAGSFAGSADLGITVFSSTDADFSLADGVDFEVTPTRYVLEIRHAGGAYQTIADGTLALITDGRAYRWTMRPTATGVDLVLPDGSKRTVIDSRVAGVSGEAATWEARSLGEAGSRLEAVSADRP